MDSSTYVDYSNLILFNVFILALHEVEWSILQMLHGAKIYLSMNNVLEYFFFPSGHIDLKCVHMAGRKLLASW